VGRPGANGGAPRRGEKHRGERRLPAAGRDLRPSDGEGLEEERAACHVGASDRRFPDSGRDCRSRDRATQRSLSTPRLSEFETWLGRYLLDTRNVELEPAPWPEPWPPEAVPLTARLTFLSDRPAVLVFRSPYPDWSGYERLEFTAFSELDRPVQLSFKIVDEDRLPTLSDVFLDVLTIEPGVNRILIPLSRVRELASGREMDMTRIHRIVLFAMDAREPFSVWVDDLRLE